MHDKSTRCRTSPYSEKQKGHPKIVKHASLAWINPLLPKEGKEKEIKDNWWFENCKSKKGGGREGGGGGG